MANFWATEYDNNPNPNCGGCKKLRKRVEESENEINQLRGILDDIISTLYGKNLGITGWHSNGEEEPMDDFFEDCGWITEESE